MLVVSLVNLNVIFSYLQQFMYYNLAAVSNLQL